MQNREFVIYFDHGGFENKGFVTEFRSKHEDITYQVETDFEKHFVWNTESGWVDLYGNSNEFIKAMGKAIEIYLSENKS